MHLCIIRTPSFQCSRNAKIYNPMYNTHLEFHSQSDDQTRLLQTSVRLAAVLDRSAGQQNSGLFILSHSRTRLHPYTASAPFGEI